MSEPKIVQLRLDRIDLVENVREKVDDALKASLAEHGLLQPITVAPRGASGRYQVLFGHRRTAAAKALGWNRIPAIVADRPARLGRAQLAENLDRKAMDPIEIATVLLAELEADPDLKPGALAKSLGRSQAWVSNKLALLDLDEAMQARITAGELSEQRAHAIRKASLPVAETGRPRLLAPDEDGRTRSIVVQLTGPTAGSVTLGVDREAATVDVVVQDPRGHGVFLVLDPAGAKLLGRRLTQASEAVGA